MAFSETEALVLLKRAHSQVRLAHAYLITGPDGSGKLSLARALCALVTGQPEDNAKAMQHPDVHVAKPESRSRRIVVDHVRELERELQMRASGGGQKVAVILDADRLTQQASNAFLKTLEEPPDHSLVILCTAQPEMLLDTIVSRCILVQLKAARAPDLSPQQRAVLAALGDHTRMGRFGMPEAFLMVAEFVRALQETRQRFQEENAAELKREEALYRQRTEGKWLEERENYYKALTEANYVRGRFALVETLIQWWADVMRQQQGIEQLDFPDHAGETSAAARDLDAPTVLRKIRALEDLRDHFGQNVQEQLAVEVAFLKVFGDPR